MSKLVLKKISFSKVIFIAGLSLNLYSYNILLVLSPFGLGIKKIPKKLKILVNRAGKTVKFLKQLSFYRFVELQSQSMFYGLFWNLLRNFFYDLTKIFYVDLEFRGMGYKGILDTKKKVQEFKFHLGYTHTLLYKVPRFLKLKTSQIKALKFKNFFLLGISRQRVKEAVQYLKSLKVKDIYKGKGLFYLDEILKLKQGKKQK